MWGTQVQLASFLETQHVVKNEKTARNYVSRLEAMGGKLDALTAEMQRQSAAGVVLPPSLLEKSITVIDDTVRPKPAESPLVTTFVERMKKAKDIDEKMQAELRDQAIAAVASGVYPAYQRMRDALIAERPKAAGVAAGVGSAAGRCGVLPADAETVHDDGLHARPGASARVSPKSRASRRKWTRCCAPRASPKVRSQSA